MQNLIELLGNGQSLNLSETDYYAAIIGASPSKGARSPLLWNAVFQEKRLSCKMHPMDVSPENLRAVISNFRADSRFIGSAIAVPYKQAALELMDDVEEEAQVIGAINCIYKKKSKLIGTNTDGAGALDALVKKLGTKEKLTGQNVLVYGVGGAGRAVAAYIATAIGPQGKLTLANRSKETASSFAEKLSSYCPVDVMDTPVPPQGLEEVDILINCSSIGFNGIQRQEAGMFSLESFTPLGSVSPLPLSQENWSPQKFLLNTSETLLKNYQQTLQSLASLKPSALVYDIVYQPLTSTLLHFSKLAGLETLNGLGMNQEQAVIAFQKATQSLLLPGMSAHEIRTIMQSV